MSNRAELARKYGFSRARITQLMNLLRLPTEIREQIGMMPERVQRHFSERRLRTIVNRTTAREQRQEVKNLLLKYFQECIDITKIHCIIKP